MANFIKPESKRGSTCIFKAEGVEITNNPVNIDLCKQLKKIDNITSSGSYWGIEFIGCDAIWWFDSEKSRDAEWWVLLVTNKKVKS